MAIVPMQKVAVVALRSQQEELIQFLHQEGVVEISNMRDVSDIDHAEVKFRTSELDSVIEQLTELASKKTLKEMKKEYTDADIQYAATHTDIRGIIDRLHQLEHEYTELKRDLHELHLHTRDTTAESVSVGSAPDDIAYITKGKSSPAAASAKRATVAATPVARKKEDTSKKEVEIQGKLAMNHEERVRISEQLPNLLRAREYLHWLNQKQAAREAIKESKRTVTIFGWVPKNMVSVLEKKLQKLSPSYAVVSVKPEAEESSPVLLRNSTIITPFESVTTLYGLPLSTEFDPTILLAGFFILFFGLCLTDAGYGLVLAAITGGYLLKKKLPIRKAPLWWLLFFGGIATFLISIPFGGWFGMTAAQAPSWMTVDTNGDGVADLFKGQVWNLGETKGITFFQNLALALGLAHLSFGMFLAGYAKWRDGRFAEAFWVDFTSLILIASAIAYFLGPQDFKQYSLYAIYASIVLMIWGKGYGSPFASRLFKGILGMLNFALGMTSNVLSYLRLLALGLVTGALALAVNLVAQQIGGLLPPIIGVPLSIVILIVGHTINIALNVLGAFIHSGRLQFVEFFSQFFEGGGRPFQPFSRSRTV